MVEIAQRYGDEGYLMVAWALTPYKAAAKTDVITKIKSKNIRRHSATAASAATNAPPSQTGTMAADPASGTPTAPGGGEGATERTAMDTSEVSAKKDRDCPLVNKCRKQTMPSWTATESRD